MHFTLRALVVIVVKKTYPYKESILQLLGTSSQALDVENIRVACDIGNWQTALKHCLELLHDGRIRGTKTSKSWIFFAKDIAPARDGERTAYARRNAQ